MQCLWLCWTGNQSHQSLAYIMWYFCFLGLSGDKYLTIVPHKGNPVTGIHCRRAVIALFQPHRVSRFVDESKRLSRSKRWYYNITTEGAEGNSWDLGGFTGKLDAHWLLWNWVRKINDLRGVAMYCALAGKCIEIRHRVQPEQSIWTNRGVCSVYHPTSTSLYYNHSQEPAIPQ